VTRETKQCAESTRRDLQRTGTSRRLVLLAGLALTACSTSQQWQLGVPGTGFDLSVTRVETRGEWLDVWLHGGDLTLRSFVPASPECAALLRPERTLRFSQGGSGSFVSGDQRCDAAGIGTLEEWRDRRRDPPGLLESPVPHAPADYDVIYRDDDVAFLRGRFPLADRLGWTSLADTIAVVPRRAACEDVLTRQVATLEYFARGSPVLALIGGETRCPIVGLLRPGAPPRSEAP
jgi:hypothetical protein